MASETTNGTGRHVVRIGVFIPTESQFLDAACVDVMGVMGHEWLVPNMTIVSHLVPQSILAIAPSVRISYIGSVKAGEPIPFTSDAALLATHHYSDAAVAPGQLDIVIVPGPDPNSTPEEGALAWLSAQAATEGVDILSVCTGIYICGAAGLLKGKRACGPRRLQDGIRKMGFGEKEQLTRGRANPANRKRDQRQRPRRRILPGVAALPEAARGDRVRDDGRGRPRPGVRKRSVGDRPAHGLPRVPGLADELDVLWAQVDTGYHGAIGGPAAAATGAAATGTATAAAAS